jgi:hypothetical protein
MGIFEPLFDFIGELFLEAVAGTGSELWSDLPFSPCNEKPLSLNIGQAISMEESQAGLEG